MVWAMCFESLETVNILLLVISGILIIHLHHNIPPKLWKNEKNVDVSKTTSTYYKLMAATSSNQIAAFTLVFR